MAARDNRRRPPAPPPLIADRDGGRTATTKLPWTFLPQGETPWRPLNAYLTSRGRRTRHRFDADRLRTALKVLTEDHRPNFVALGQDEFDGYAAFGFPRLGFCVMENFDYGNATYVFGEDWERLSRRTKAELISESLPIARLIHGATWAAHVERILHGPRTRSATASEHTSP